MNDENLIIYGYLISSTYRIRTINAIGNETKTPTEIAHDSGIKINHMSKILKELKDKDVAVCINEEKRKNRLYQLTSRGKEIYEYMKTAPQ